MTQSKALEVNIETSRVEVTLDPRYETLLEITAGYHGLSEGLRAYLLEVCHPLKNWRYIVGESRRFSLQNFHLFAKHPRGPEGTRLFLDILFEALRESQNEVTRADAADNLLVYLEQIINEAGPELARFQDVLESGFERLAELDEADFFLVVRSFYSLNRLAGALARRAAGDGDFSALRTLLFRYLTRTYEYWLSEPDPGEWFAAEAGYSDPALAPGDIFAPLSHRSIGGYMEALGEIGGDGRMSSAEAVSRMAGLPGFREIVALYDQAPRRLFRAGRSLGLAEQWMLLFLFYIMNVSGLSSIHERTLRDINRTMTLVIGRADLDQIHALLAKTFAILKESCRRFPLTALSLVENIGQAVYNTDDSDLVEYFIDSVTSLGFQTPNLSGVRDDWAIQANAAHIQNIRAWLKLIELRPVWSKKLLSALIVHLALGDVFIKDTDLFPRDITGLFNSDVQPVYNLVKQLCRLFPAYFNEIGAEGRLRDISTSLDELVHRRDSVVHFLRKQSHVESSPRTVALIEAILEFWRTRDKGCLLDLIPPSIHARVATEGLNVDGLNALMNRFYETGRISRTRDLLTLAEEDFAAVLAEDVPGVSEEDRERLRQARLLYQMLYQKYHTDLVGLEAYLDQLPAGHVPRLEDLRSALGRAEPREKLAGLLEYLETLKEVITSGRAFEAREDIYIKRHIAVDIPSMYGSYREPKFDALGLTFRLEPLVNTLFQELIDGMDLGLVTRATFVRIYDYFQLFDRALRLDGINSREFERQIDLLGHAMDIRGFAFSQYLDIFRGFSQVVSNIVNDHFNNPHHNQLLRVMSQAPVERLLPKYRPRGEPIAPKEAAGRAAEIFLRDRIATSLGLQPLDQFVGRILGTLFQQDHELRGDMLRRLLDYNPVKAVTPLSPVIPELADVIHLGAKGFNLVKIKALGLPVPPGFIITTSVFRLRKVIEGYGPAEEHFRGLLARQVSALEQQAGRKFGDPRQPLLLSVRSGSSISQPGMLATFLDVGLNEEIVEGMAAGRENGGAWWAWDCYRRLLQTFGMAGGLARDDFDALIAEAKRRYGLPYKRDLSGEQMKEVALAYRDFVASHGLVIETRPFEQLYQAIKGVFDSWFSPKAESYRKIMGISDEWGTAVTVQSMVFGNLSERSGAGVFFTHNPRWSGDKLMIWGDFALSNQGEDVVSGLVETLPINQEQAEIENRSGQVTLETHFPEIYKRVRELAKAVIYEWGFGPQEMEFTFEGPRAQDLYFLQTRDMVLRERREHYSLDVSQLPREDFLGHGIGVSGGGLAGRIVFTLEEINQWRQKEPATPLILIRADTVPDDIREIHAADGLLTARGGSTSHAAIVAYRLKKTCVVGCRDMLVEESRRTCRFNRREFFTGDWVSIDGLAGLVYKGRVAGDVQVKETGRLLS
ncbi:MAG: PEP/pyruvate-binding domain-containing protein [Thermodesulfobacteriota bacterium]